MDKANTVLYFFAFKYKTLRKLCFLDITILYNFSRFGINVINPDQKENPIFHEELFLDANNTM